MPINLLLLLVQLILMVLMLYLVWRQGTPNRFAVPSGFIPRNGDIWEDIRFFVQFQNVRGSRP